MKSQVDSAFSLTDQRRNLLAWGLLAVALLILYIPVVWELMNGLWKTNENTHGPIILLVSLWYLVHKSRELAKEPDIKIAPALLSGWVCMLLGLLLYVVGRSQTVYLLELGSLIPFLMGGILILFGTVILKKLWFALFFMLFMIPLPGSLVDIVTQPMKIMVSWGAEQLLYQLGYPTARSGVVISIGQYRLLVADACAGLNSLFTLESLGLLYLNVVRHSSAVRNVVLATLIIPISYAANLVRVMLLALITYYFGEAAGQGFIHEFSGMLLFITSLLLIIFADGALRVGVKAGQRSTGQQK